MENEMECKDKTEGSSQLTILVAEDEEYNFLYVYEVTKKLNIRLIRAYNGQMAVELCQQNPDIDIVLMDVSMPVMDGYQATRLIKKEFPNLPVIIQTAHLQSSEKDQAFKGGCDFFLNKPIARAELLGAFRKFAPEHVTV